MTDYVSWSDDGPIRTMTMSNPGRMNAVPTDGWPVLAEAFEDFDSSSARVLVLTGADGEFCAGADMNRSRPEVPSAADNAERMRSVNRAAIALHFRTRSRKSSSVRVGNHWVSLRTNASFGRSV